MTPKPSPPCLVTGATGFLGGALVRRLAAEGRAVHALVRTPVETGKLPAGVEQHYYDGSTETLHALLQRLAADAAPTIFHLAADYGAASSADRVQAVLAANTALPTQLAEACRGIASPGGETVRFVNAGSYWQYDRHGAYKPNTLYAAAKHAAQDILDFYATEGALRVVTLIMFDVFGPRDERDKLIPKLLRAVRDGERVETSPGYQKMDFVHVDDAVDALLAGEQYLQSAPSHGVHPRFAINTGRQITLREMVAALTVATGKAADVAWGAREYPAHQIMEPVTTLPRLSGWSPRRTLEQGLQDAWGELLAQERTEATR